MNRNWRRLSVAARRHIRKWSRHHQGEFMAGPIVCFGELLLRMGAPGRERLLQSGAVEVHAGGAEANVAVALAGLEHRTIMVSAVPANALGEHALFALRGHGVDCQHVRTGEGRMGLYFLDPGAGLRPSSIVYDRSDSVFARLPADAFDWDAMLAGAGRLHLSGITPALGAGAAELALAAAQAAQRLDVPVSFDGNFRAGLWRNSGRDPREPLSRLVELSDVFFGNHRDVALLLDRDIPGDTADQRREAAEAAFAAFPRLRFLASTHRTAASSDHHRLLARIDTREAGWETPAVELHAIVDRIGTGDAFAAGLLHGLHEGLPPEEAARIGLAAGCLKHFVPGDFSRCTRADLADFLSGQFDVRR
jgi:2-dehydro-3-deoxygluconokinase